MASEEGEVLALSGLRDGRNAYIVKRTGLTECKVREKTSRAENRITKQFP